MAQQQLLDDEAGLDGLAEADVVGEQQIRARRLQRPAQRLELVGLDVGAAAEGRLVRVGVGGGDRAPAHGVDERGEGVGVVEGLGVDGLGKALVGGDRVADLELPDDAELLAEPVLVERLQGDDVLSCGRLSSAGLRGRPCPDVGDGPGRAPNLDHPAGLGNLWS